MVGCGRKSNSFKLYGCPFTCKNEEDPFKKNVLEGSQQISHCKSMRIFYDAQGKLTPQSEFDSTLNSKIQSKMKALEWSQECNTIHQF